MLPPWNSGQMAQMAKSQANARPTLAASCVAASRPSRGTRAARKTRPPSIGKEGIKLNSTSMKLIRPNASIITASRGLNGYTHGAPNQPSPPSARLTAGPASAVWISSIGRRGIWLKRAMPPMGKSRISKMCAPLARATNEWPTSCNTTLPKSPTAPIAPYQRPIRPSTGMNEKAKNGRKISRVMCTRTGMPNTWPME